MSNLRNIYGYLIEGDYAAVLNSLPPGGDILLVLIVFVCALTFPAIRSNLTRLLLINPQGLTAILIGGFFFILDRHIVPFAVACLTGTACYLTVWESLARRLANVLNSRRLAEHLTNISLSTFLLIGGIFFYIGSQGIIWSAEALEYRKYLATESEVLVAVTLPSYYDDRNLRSSEYAQRIESIRREYFQNIRNILDKTLKHLKPKIELLPLEVKKAGHDSEQEWRLLEEARKNASVLLSYRKGLGSPVDLVIQPFFGLSSTQKDDPYFYYKLRISKLDREITGYTSWPGANEEWVHLDNIRNDYYLAALIGISKVVVRTANQRLDDGCLSNDEFKRVWSGLIHEFKDHYSTTDEIRLYRPDDWIGHQLAKSESCSGKTCVEKWLEAYTKEPAKPFAREDMEKTFHQVGLSIQQSAMDGQQ